MTTLHVERLGGLAGFGGTRSHIRSHGQLEIAKLSAEEQKVVEQLFQSTGKPKSQTVADGFRYRISRTTPSGTDSIELAEAEVPAALVQCVKDELI